ncbi:site-specific integrase [Deinococcus indicus]|uniref:tyrosine-type recombinase/integrase n=1 Tax=Deinococcus indicus TaxID=223556 RepID=UPI00174B806A|nr:site-specific integrase [Deinococcus indicus]GHG38916.1 site-specific integrase [Deinococcus indicus]
MSKRANGEGTISARRKDGKVVGWKGSVVVGYEGDKMERRWVSGKTKADVQQKMAELRTALHTGMLADSEGLTVTQYMARWLDAKERDGVKPNTLRSYRDTDRLHISPHLGRVKLDKLRPLDVERMMNALRKEGKSAQVLAYALRVLKMALRQAVRWQMVPRNVADAVTAPKVPRSEMQVWDAGQVAAFLDASQGNRLHAAFYLALMTGMRRGELLGLQWADIDWERSRLTVRHNLVEIRLESAGRVMKERVDRKTGKVIPAHVTLSQIKTELQTPKTAGSRRTIVLSPGTMSKLKEHQQQQAQERQAAKEAWQGPAEGGFVFASEIGTAIDPRNMNRWHAEIMKAAGVPQIRFHDMRHTAASLMIRQGIPPKTVSERLGHADVGFTLRTYTHLYDDQRQEAAFDLADLFPRSGATIN